MTWFTSNDLQQGVNSPDYETSVASIVASLESFVGKTADGKPKLNVNAAVTDSINQIALTAVGGSVGFSNLFTTMPLDIRAILERASGELAKAQASGSYGTLPNLQPLLDDCETKSKAVTDYFTKLFDVELKSLIEDGRFGFGQLEKNVPPVDDMTKEDRFYVATFVNDWENESAPSRVSRRIQLGKKDTVSIARPTVPTGRDITYWRLYRSNSGSQQAAFQYVGNEADELGIPIADATFDDDVLNSELQEICPSMLWDHPPDDLCNIVAGANGVHLGHVGRTLRPSEDYTPYAFPEDYGITIHDEIVGKCAWQQMWFVGTRGRPVFVGGPNAANLSHSVCDGDQACVSERSICPTAAGVVYASPDGLCLATPGAPVQVLTAQHFTREEWQALGPENMVVQEHDGVLYLFRPTPLSSLPATDAFDGTSGTNIKAHLTDQGSAWTVGTFSVPPVTQPPLQLDGGGRLTLIAPDGSNNSFDPVVNTVMSTPDYYVEIDFYFSATNVNNKFGVVLRNSNPGVPSNDQFITVMWQGTNQVLVGRAFNTTFGATYTVGALAINTLHTLRAEVVGNAVTVKLNGATVGTTNVVLTNPSSPGRAGICGYSPSPVAFRFFGRFEAGPLPAATPATTYALAPSGKLTTISTGHLTAAFRDAISDKLCLALGSDATSLFTGTTRDTATWTKRMVFPGYEGFGWLHVASDFTDANGAAASVTVTISTDAGVVLTTKVVTSRTPVRLPAFRHREVIVTVSSKARVTEVLLASNATELRGV